jgi:hypothetical protein
VVDDDVDDPGADSFEPTISIHALTRIQPRHGRTMQLRVAVNGAYILALLDSESTHNLIDTRRWRGWASSSPGDRLTSPGYCRAMSFLVDGEAFNIDCYGLALGSFEMVLGVPWLESLGPVLWDFGHHTMAFVRDGHRVMWATPDTAIAPPTSLLAASGDIMEELLDEFDPLFIGPTELPPP